MTNRYEVVNLLGC